MQQKNIVEYKYIYLNFVQGASILRMLEDWMGKDKFRDGCRVSPSKICWISKEKVNLNI